MGSRIEFIAWVATGGLYTTLQCSSKQLPRQHPLPSNGQDIYTFYHISFIPPVTFVISFEHAGLTGYIYAAITFHHFSLFHSELKTCLSENLILHLVVFMSVGLISWL